MAEISLCDSLIKQNFGTIYVASDSVSKSIANQVTQFGDFTMPLRLTSPAFEQNQPISPRYTALGENVSPPLQWSGAPKDIREWALICEDPDAPLPTPFTHWIVYGLDANISKLPEGLAQQEHIIGPVVAKQGMNSLLKPGYTGPMPPPWDRAHRYQFRLYALNAPLTLSKGAGREEFLRAIENKVIEQAELVGTYERSRSDKVRTVLKWGVPALIGGVTLALWPRIRKGLPHPRLTRVQ